MTAAASARQTAARQGVHVGNTASRGDRAPLVLVLASARTANISLVAVLVAAAAHTG